MSATHTSGSWMRVEDRIVAVMDNGLRLDICSMLGRTGGAAEADGQLIELAPRMFEALQAIADNEGRTTAGNIARDAISLVTRP